VAQLYLRDDVGSTSRPVRELRGFRRVTLQPGETRTLRFTLGRDAMAMLDAGLRRVIEPGTFTVWVGGSSAVTNEAKFTVTGETLVLAPPPPRYH
jgi:beta-glucosidase